MGFARILKTVLHLFTRNRSDYKRHNRLLVKWHLSKATYISVRDEDSFLYLKELGMKRDIELVPDPVLTWKRKNNQIGYKNILCMGK